MATERRSDRRIAVNIPVMIFGVNRKGQPFSGDATIINLSRHGACLRTSQALEPGQIVLLESPQAGLVEVEVKWIGDSDLHSVRAVGVYRQQFAAAFGDPIPPLSPDG